MPETRTRVSGDYVKTSNTCSIWPTTTRTRVSGSYTSPFSSYCGRSMYYSPSSYSGYNPPFYSNPAPTYYSPTYSARSLAAPVSDIGSALVVMALCVAAVAAISIAPACHYEEVCHSIGFGLDSCHLEQVCMY